MASLPPAGPVIVYFPPFFAGQGRLAHWWDRPLCLSMGRREKSHLSSQPWYQLAMTVVTELSQEVARL